MSSSYPEIYLQFLASVLLTIILIGAIVTLFLSYQKKRIIHEKKISLLQADHEKELLKTQLEIQEEVLSQIALEIHDNIGQVLLMVNINNTILQASSIPDASKELLQENKQFLTKAIEDLSVFSRNLHSQRVTDIGVFKLIKQDLEYLSSKGVFTLSIEEDDEPNRHHLILKDSQIVIYRIFQEILKNILKHSKASHVGMHVRSTNDITTFIITDNGIGFDPEAESFHARSGLGIRSFYERTQLIGGQIRIDSSYNAGTQIVLIIPHTKVILRANES